MKLRWLITCGKHGVKDEPCLQYWVANSRNLDGTYGEWINVEIFECEVDQEEEFRYDESAY